MRRVAAAIVFCIFCFPAYADLVSVARRDLGKTGAQFGAVHKRLWCGEALGRWARVVGVRLPGNPNWAADWLQVGRRTSSPTPGAIAVIGRSRIHHVGVVTGVDASGNPIIISGNHNDRVVETAYPRSMVIAYVIP